MTRLVSVIEVPSGRFSDMLNSLWSSGGIQSRPTKAFKGKVRRKIPKAMAITCPRWPRAQSSSRLYRLSKRRKNFAFFSPPWPLPVALVRKRELSIGVRVKLMSMETRMEKAMVQPNWLTYRRA